MKIHPADYPFHLLRRTLYPHARPLAGLLKMLVPDHFKADQDFIEDVSHMRYQPDFDHAVRDFVSHPGNRTFLRRRLRLRISVRRMLAVIDAISLGQLPGETAEQVRRAGSAPPQVPEAESDGTEGVSRGGN